MRLRSFSLVASVLFLASPAARAGGFECPARGGDAWREIRSPHFVLQTDLSSKKARELAGELERMLDAIRSGLFRNPPEFPGVVRVYAFRSDFDLFAPPGARAFYTQSGIGEGVIVLPGEIGDVQRITVAHELTHHVAARVFARQPLWFGEGLATFMESLAQYSLDTTPTIGGIAKHRYAAAFPYHGGIGKVLTARGRLEGERSYPLAWALVHYLVNRQPQGFGQLQARFARGQDPDDAWREVFPQWDPADPKAMDALDDEIGRYLARGKFGYRPVQLPPPPPVTERPLSSAEAHAARLSLRWRNRGKPVPETAFLEEVEETLREDPGDPVALSAKATQKGADAPALARRAVEAHPDDVRAWLLLARALPQQDVAGREAALRRAVDVEPTNPTAMNDLAWALLGDGRSGEALPLARRAAGLAPADSAVLDTLGGVLEDLGQCADALVVQRRASDVLPEGLSDEARAPILKRLARLETACGAARAAPAPTPAVAPGPKP